MPAGVPHVIVAEPERKPWWWSKTLWINALVLALAAAEQQIGVLDGLLPVAFYKAAAFGLPVLNAVLRLITTQGVKL